MLKTSTICIGRDSRYDFNSFIEINNMIISNLKHKKVYDYNRVNQATVKISLSSKTKDLLEKNAVEHLRFIEQQYQNETINNLRDEITSLEEEKSSLQESLQEEIEKNDALTEDNDELQMKIDELEEKIKEYKQRISELLEE